MRVWSSARAKTRRPVLGAAEPDGVGGGAGQGAVVQPHRRTGPAAVPQGGEPGPADGQLGEGGEPGSGAQPDHDPPPHPPHPVRREQRAPGGYADRERKREQSQEDGHDGLPSGLSGVLKTTVRASRTAFSHQERRRPVACISAG